MPPPFLRRSAKHPPEPNCRFLTTRTAVHELLHADRRSRDTDWRTRHSDNESHRPHNVYDNICPPSQEPWLPQVLGERGLAGITSLCVVRTGMMSR